MKKIAITGHRELLYPEEVREEIRLSLQYFQQHNTPMEALSAMAAGTDTLFAAEALNSGLPLRAILPFPPDIYRSEFSHSEWEQVAALLTHPNCTTTVLYTMPPANKEEKENTYLETGRQLVKQADILLAVWDGQPSQGKGGTADVIALAKQNNKELHIIKALRQPQPGETPLQDELNSDYKKEDDDAKLYKNRCFMQAWRAGIIAGVLAALSFAAGIAIKLGEAPGSHQWHTLKFLLGLGEIILLAASLYLLLIVARKAKNNFLTHRRNAEFLRALRWFRNAGIPVQAAPPDTEQKNKIILKDAYQLPAPGSRIIHIPHAARMTWILAAQQSAYHQTKKKEYKTALHDAEKRLMVIKIIFFILVGFNFILECIEFFNGYLTPALHALQPWLVFGWMAMPPFYAAIEGVKYFSEWEKHMEKSEKMIKEFDRIANEIQYATDETLITTKANELYTVMSLENSSWSEWWKERHPVPGL